MIFCTYYKPATFQESKEQSYLVLADVSGSPNYVPALWGLLQRNSNDWLLKGKAYPVQRFEEALTEDFYAAIEANADKTIGVHVICYPHSLEQLKKDSKDLLPFLQSFMKPLTKANVTRARLQIQPLQSPAASAHQVDNKDGVSTFVVSDSEIPVIMYTPNVETMMAAKARAVFAFCSFSPTENPIQVTPISTWQPDSDEFGRMDVDSFILTNSALCPGIRQEILKNHAQGKKVGLHLIMYPKSGEVFKAALTACNNDLKNFFQANNMFRDWDTRPARYNFKTIDIIDKDGTSFRQNLQRLGKNTRTTSANDLGGLGNTASQASAQAQVSVELVSRFAPEQKASVELASSSSAPEQKGLAQPASAGSLLAQQHEQHPIFTGLPSSHAAAAVKTPVATPSQLSTVTEPSNRPVV